MIYTLLFFGLFLACLLPFVSAPFYYVPGSTVATLPTHVILTSLSYDAYRGTLDTHTLSKLDFLTSSLRVAYLSLQDEACTGPWTTPPAVCSGYYADVFMLRMKRPLDLPRQSMYSIYQARNDATYGDTLLSSFPLSVDVAFSCQDEFQDGSLSYFLNSTVFCESWTPSPQLWVQDQSLLLTQLERMYFHEAWLMMRKYR
jgi:hypothetical protein